jgi:hypothetical protein
MLELSICEQINKGYKVVLPKNTTVRLLSKYSESIYKSPSQVKKGDRLKFVNWVSASSEDRRLWKHYLEVQ